MCYRLRMFWNQILHGWSVAVFWLSNVQKWPLKLGRMYQTAHQNVGFNALRLNRSNLNPVCLCYDSKPAELHKARWAIQLLNHLLELPNRASSRYFQERSSTVTFILKFFSYSIVNLLNISSVFTNFRHFSQRFRRIQSWYRFHLHGGRLLAGDFHKFELWFYFCNAKFYWFVRYQMRVLIG